MLKYIEYKSYIEVRVDSNNKLIGKFVLDIDGFYYFVAEDSNGYWSDWVLLQLGTKLTEINRQWNNHLKEALK